MSAPARLCRECRDLYDRWLDTSPAIVSPGVKIASGAAYDDTAAGAEANRRRRVDDWRALVNRQHALIHDICSAKHRPGQMALEVAA